MGDYKVFRIRNAKGEAKRILHRTSGVPDPLSADPFYYEASCKGQKAPPPPAATASLVYPSDGRQEDAIIAGGTSGKTALGVFVAVRIHRPDRALRRGNPREGEEIGPPTSRGAGREGCS